MENNSNDTLFGFTAITDIFTEQVGNTISQNDDIDDEELDCNCYFFFLPL